LRLDRRSAQAVGLVPLNPKRVDLAGRYDELPANSDTVAGHTHGLGCIGGVFPQGPRYPPACDLGLLIHAYTSHPYRRSVAGPLGAAVRTHRGTHTTMDVFFLTQPLWLVALLGLGALAVLVLGADVAVRKLIGLAEYFGLSTTFMGMTVVSLATSIPEITAHFTASVGILADPGRREILSSVVLGANIGSDVVQQTVIMGMVVFIAGGLYFRRYFLWKSMLPMIGTTLMCIVLGWDRNYSRVDGLILFGTFIAYMYYLYWDERKYYEKGEAPEAEEATSVPTSRDEAIRYAIVALVAMGFTIGAAQVVLNVTEVVVLRTGLSGSLIGVVTLGLASALPELTTAISGVGHKEHGISLGTLVGSNITNPLVAIGGGALLSTYYVPEPLVLWDLPWETITGAILWAILWFTRGRLNRVGAVYLIALYLVYLIPRYFLFPTDASSPQWDNLWGAVSGLFG